MIISLSTHRASLSSVDIGHRHMCCFIASYPTSKLKNVFCLSDIVEGLYLSDLIVSRYYCVILLNLVLF